LFFIYKEYLFMRKVYLFIFFCLALTKITIGQITYTWIGPSTGGDYQLASNWSSPRNAIAATDILSFNAATDITLSNVPANETIGAIKINSGTGKVYFSTGASGGKLTLNAAIPLIYTTAGSILADQYVTIAIGAGTAFAFNGGIFGISPSSGGKIIINRAVTIGGGTLSVDVPGTGGCTISNTVSIQYNSGTFTSVNPSSIIWQNGSTYTHNVTGASPSAIPASTWNIGSTCIINAMSSGSAIAPTGLTTSAFYNLTWNCFQAIDINLNLAGATMTINGTFLVSSTGSSSKALILAGAGGGTVNAANYTQNSGATKVVLQSSKDITTLSITGVFTNNAGVFEGVSGTEPGVGILDLKGTVAKNGSTWQSTSSDPGSQMNVQFSGTATQSVTIGGTWSDPVAGRTNIILTNPQGVSLIGGSTLKVINTANTVNAAFCSLGGPVTTTGTGVIAYSGAGTAGTSLLYNNNVLQTASTIEFPASAGPTNLAINNIAGVAFPATFSRTIPGILTLQTGNLAIGSGNSLSLTNALANQIVNGTGFITTGTLSRLFPASGLPVSAGNASRFPFGTGITDRSLNVFFTSSVGGAAGMISVTHTPVPGVTVIPPTLNDNGVTLDKRTNTNWTITTSGGFNSGAATIFLTALGTNIGSVTTPATVAGLRLTDGTTSYGTLITSSGTDVAPIVGKRDLLVSDITGKTLYFGSDNTNSLQIITFEWNGSTDTKWDNATNWTTTGTGYPSAPTEIAYVIAGPLNMPEINNIPISVLRLTVGAGASLTMKGTASMNVVDSITFDGTAFFDPTSFFTYSSQSLQQVIAPLTYGNLTLSGLGPKKYPNGIITITGSTSANGPYLVSGAYPSEVTTGTNTIVFAGTGAQRIAPTFYNNLTINNDRGGAAIQLGPQIGPTNTISIAGNFVINATNYAGASFNNVVDFISTSTTISQPIPGFIYSSIKNSGNGLRTLDPAGSSDPTHVISVVSYQASTLTPIVTGSKVKMIRSTASPFGGPNFFNDLEISGNLNGALLDFNGTFYISGQFTVTATNFVQGTTKNSYFYFNGTTDQTIPAFKTNTATNTPAFKFDNITIAGGNRNVYLGGTITDTIFVTKGLQVPISTGNIIVNLPFNPTTITISPFNTGKGFIAGTSTVNFSVDSYPIPVLIPNTGTISYNNVAITGGTHTLDGDMTIGGNLSVNGTDASLATLNIGNNTSPRTLNVKNIFIGGTSSTSQITGQLDMFSSTTPATKINLADSISITGSGQLAQTGSTNGTITFNSSFPLIQGYTNTSLYNNGAVNFIAGDGSANTYVKLVSTLNLLRSSTAANVSALTVANNATLDCSTKNIISNGAGNAIFNLNSGATLVTANTGGIEGAASGATDGTIINDATIIKMYDSLASYIFNASAATNMSFPATPATFTMANLTIGDSTNVAPFNLNKPIAVSGALTLRRNGIFALGDYDVTLISTATNTAKVAPVQAGAAVSYSGAGRFNVERNYRGLRRAWYLVTSPLSATGSVFDTWQNGGIYAPGRGTFVTGTIAGTGAGGNGLDNGPQLNSSLEVGSSVAVVNDTKAALLSSGAASAANKGYFLFVRGDRIAANYNTSNYTTTTLSSRGKIQIGTQSFAASSTAGAFNIIGNPYASPVSFANTIKTNLDNNTVYLWDPYLNSTLGAYTTIILDNTGIVTNIIPASPGGLATVGQPLTFQSSQAFWVRTATSGAASLQFNETDKSTQFNVGTFREMSGLTKSFKANLNLIEPNDSIILADGNLAQFDNQYSKEVNLEDLLKFGNTKEMLAFQRDGKSLSVERRPDIIANDTLFFKLTKTARRNYQFQFVPTNMAGVLTAYLEDNYTNARTMVSLSSTSTFNFTINGNAGSAADDRFRIVFTASAAGPLAVTYKTIKAYQVGKDIAIDWTVENEINISKYDVEKSTDGTNFTRVNTTIAKGASGIIDYNLIDNKVLEGNNFYRIKNYNQGGSFDYSSVVLVKLGKSGASISIYPNPVTGNCIGMAMTNMEQGIYQVRLINTIGQTLLTKRITHSGGNSMETIVPDTQLSKGIYQLEIKAPDNSIRIIKVIVQ
jgi:hypothetical protein